MAKINNNPPKAPLWPWGAARNVRERMVEPSQLGLKRARKGKQLGLPIPSFALLDWIGPAHSSEDLRLPLPPAPPGHEAELGAFLDLPYLEAAAARGKGENRRVLDRALSQVSATPERSDRLKALLGREAQMLDLLNQKLAWQDEIRQRIKEESKDLA